MYYRPSGEIAVETRTPIGRSYYDLAKQNATIGGLKKQFGGTFTTDEGKGRYLRAMMGPPSAPCSGCKIAFDRFGFNLVRALLCHQSQQFPDHPPGKWKVLQELDPRILANNTLVPFLVAAMEEYFKATFVALLRYSPRKETFLKGVRLQGDQLVRISDSETTIEDEVADSLSFQRPSAICKNFDALDPKLDLAGVLRKPFRRRKQSLLDSLEAVVVNRHEFIHRATLDMSLSDERITDTIYDLDSAMTRVYRRITSHYGYVFDRGWYLGRRSAQTKDQRQARKSA